MTMKSLVDLGEWYTEDAGLDGDETPYIRADLHEARIEGLEAERDALKEAISEILVHGGSAETYNSVVEQICRGALARTTKERTRR